MTGALSRTIDDVDCLSGLTVQTLSSVAVSTLDETLQAMKALEKRSFPTNETWTITKDMIKKQTIQVYCVFANLKARADLVAYALCMRTRKTLWLHKICVTEKRRRQGVGELLLTYIQGKAEVEHCRQIDLWVDESRVAAKALYWKCGFIEKRKQVDYYTKGRHGIQMTYEI